MKNTKKLIGIYLIALFVFLCFSSVMRTIALFTSFNSNTMHFENGFVFPLSAISVAVAIVLFFSFFFLAPKKYKLAPDCSAIQTFIPSGIISVALLFMSFSMFSRYSNSNVNTNTVPFIRYIAIALTILAILVAVFFFLGLMFTKRVSSVKAAFGICAVVFVALYGVFLYFSKEIHPTNSPNKIIDEMAYFSTALFLLYETRISLGRDLWKPYISFGLISALLTGYSAIPALILYFVNGTVISNTITETVLTLALFVYISVKILLTLKFPEDNQCKMANVIERLATRREEELAERRKASRARVYYNNDENEISEESTGDDLEEQASALSEGQISFELDNPIDENQTEEQ